MPPPHNGTDTLAALDIGTNSVHGVVARVSPGKAGFSFDVLEREKTVVRLGSSGGDMRQLADDAIDRAVAAITRFRQLAEAHGAPVRAVATSATREADNRQLFLDRARHEAGVDIEVVSGAEEARLIHLGVLQALPVYDHRLLLCDIGGGSTELLVGLRGEVLAARSLKLGAIRLSERFFRGRLLHPSALDACRRHVRSTLAPFAHEITRLGVEVAVGSSGTITALAEMAVVQAGGSKPRSSRGLVLTRAGLDAVVELLAAAPTAEERAALPGADASRADIILAGAVILEQVVHALDLDELVVSDYALREGVLLDTWQRRHGASLHHLSDLRRRSVVGLAELMDDDPAHSAQVARLALQLFDGLAGRHGLGDAARELLEAAALLCHVGVLVSHSQHHKHSAYVIRSTDRLTGFTEHEVELIAVVARYHRKSEPKAKHPEFAALDDDEKRLVTWLSALLRVAIGLDRNHAARVAQVAVDEAVGEGIVLAVTPVAGQDVSLELYAAKERTGPLEAVTGVPIEVSAQATRGR